MQPDDKVTFPWQGRRTKKMVELLAERGIGFELNRDGLTVHLAEGTTPEECRHLLNQAMDEVMKPKSRRKSDVTAK